MPQIHKDLTGTKIGSILFIKRIENRGQTVMYLGRCECGIEKVFDPKSVKKGFAKRGEYCCGCKYELEKGRGAKNYLFSDYKFGARKRNLNFHLSFEEFISLTSGNCSYCGEVPKNITPEKVNINGSYTYNGIDRVDNTKGYITENCTPCCTICNTAKKTLTKEQFLNWAERLYKHSILNPLVKIEKRITLDTKQLLNN